MVNQMKINQEHLGNAEKAMNNQERYPPTPLPFPTQKLQTVAPTTAQPLDSPDWKPVLLETGQRVMVNGTSGVVVEASEFTLRNDIIRRGFIRKVYLIVMAQLVFTSGIIMVFTLHEPTKLFVLDNFFIFWMAVIANLVVLISLACCESARRKYPINFICLALYTFTWSVLLGVVSTLYENDEILIAVGITTLLVVVLTIYAIQTKYDFTPWGGVLLCSLACIVIFSIVALATDDQVMYTAFASIGALIACCYIIYDTQLIVGGKHKYQFNPEEYIFAALTLYVDIVRLFIYILRLVRRR